MQQARRRLFNWGGGQLIKAVGVLAYVSSAWIYCENNTRDRQQRDIRCRSICQHHWGPLTGHSVAPLHALRVAATAVWAPAPSFGARGRETARRREEAPSRASPVSNQKRTEGRTPTAVKGRPKDARHRANCFRPTKATLQPGSRRRAGLSRDVAFHSQTLLWGESRSLARNTAAFRRRFRLQ